MIDSERIHACPRARVARGSTRRQGRSGPGLEAQQAAVRQCLNCGNWKIVEKFTEGDSGRALVDSETTLALNIALVEYLGELWIVVTCYRPSLVCSLLRQSLPRSRQSDTFRISQWSLRAAKVEAETKRPPEGGLSVAGVIAIRRSETALSGDTP
jgi:hypothetical protein